MTRALLDVAASVALFAILFAVIALAATAGKPWSLLLLALAVLAAGAWLVAVLVRRP